MNASKTKSLIRRVFGSQERAARELCYNPRTVRYWCAVGCPPHVHHVLRDLGDGLISIEVARMRLRDERSKRHRIGDRIKRREVVKAAAPAA